jgi:hypothetical protein
LTDRKSNTVVVVLISSLVVPTVKSRINQSPTAAEPRKAHAVTGLSSRSAKLM